CAHLIHVQNGIRLAGDAGDAAIVAGAAAATTTSAGHEQRDCDSQSKWSRNSRTIRERLHHTAQRQLISKRPGVPKETPRPKFSHTAVSRPALADASDPPARPYTDGARMPGPNEGEATLALAP